MAENPEKDEEKPAEQPGAKPAQPTQPAPQYPQTYAPPPPAARPPGYYPPPYHKKSLFWAIILSIIIPGTGHFYLGRTYEGLLFLGVWAAFAIINAISAFIGLGIVASIASTLQFVTGIIAAAFVYRYVQDYNYTLQFYGAPPRWAVPS